MPVPNHSDLREPRLQMAEGLVSKGSLDASTVVVPYDYNVCHFEIFDCVLQDCHCILIELVDLIGDIAMHEKVSDLGSHHVLWDHPGIRASDPKESRILAFCVSLEVLGIVQGLMANHFEVIVKEVLLIFD